MDVCNLNAIEESAATARYFIREYGRILPMSADAIMTALNKGPVPIGR